MKKLNKLEIIFSYLQELASEDKEVIITSSMLTSELEFNCAPLMKEMVRIKALIRVSKEHAKLVEYKINPDAEFKCNETMNASEFYRQQRLAEKRASERCVMLHNILFNVWGVSHV